MNKEADLPDGRRRQTRLAPQAAELGRQGNRQRAYERPAGVAARGWIGGNAGSAVADVIRTESERLCREEAARILWGLQPAYHQTRMA
jgi:hypothetical protein